MAASTWAQDIKNQCDVCPITSPSYCELRAKHCLMSGYALFCYSKLIWNDGDLETYLSHLLRFYNGLTFASLVSQDFQTKIDEIKSLCYTETAKRLDEIMRLLESDRSCLTRLVFIGSIGNF